MFTRKRLLIAVLVLLTAAAAAAYLGRFALARWGVGRALAAAGLQPATFQIDSVGLASVRVANLSVGSQAWFTAGKIDVTFTLADLLAARVRTIRPADVRWTVQSRDGSIDWGYTPAAKPSEPSPLILPCDLIEVTDSLLRIVTPTATHEIQFGAQLTPAGTGAANAQLDLTWQGRKASIAAKLTSTPQQLALDMDGHAEYANAADAAPSDPATPKPRAQWHAALRREQATSVTQLDLDLTLHAIAERIGEQDLAFSQAIITAHASMGSGGAADLSDLTVTLTAKDLAAAGITLDTAELTATKSAPNELELEAGLTAQDWAIPAARGSVRWATTVQGAGVPASTIFSATLQTTKPAALNLDAAGITGRADSLTAAARAETNASGFHILDGHLILGGGSMQAGDLTASDAHLQAALRDAENIDIMALNATVGDGGTISAAPFTWNIHTPHLETLVTMKNLTLEHWLPIITSNHASGEGRMSGDAQLGLDWSSGSMKLTQLKGTLLADPPRGYIQTADAEALGELLDKQDPRFATDEVMRPVRDKIISALRDFAFQKLTIDLSRRGSRTIALTSLSGFGRHGDDPQGLNLTLDLQAQDSALNLASRIASKARMNKAARSSLEDFFRESPTGQETAR